MGWECRYNEGETYCTQNSGVYISWKTPVSKSEQEIRSRGDCEEEKLSATGQCPMAHYHIMGFCYHSIRFTETFFQEL